MITRLICRGHHPAGLSSFRNQGLVVEGPRTGIDVGVLGLVGMADIGHVHGLRLLGDLVLQTLVDEVGHVQLRSEWIVVTFLHLLLLVLFDQRQVKLLGFLFTIVQNILNDFKIHPLLNFPCICSQMLHIYHVHGFDPGYFFQVFQTIF